ncbi:hypothetical protein [Kribbella lupini]|uniref:HEAT repeat protein n=1 Tax=Kribbella lupini TaxID=291602 RepID=A0ABP4LS62_9ACTN
MEFDENRALARKAVRALGALRADEALRRVVETEDAVVREFAVKELARRKAQD